MPHQVAHQAVIVRFRVHLRYKKNIHARDKTIVERLKLKDQGANCYLCNIEVFAA